MVLNIDEDGINTQDAMLQNVTGSRFSGRTNFLRSTSGSSRDERLRAQRESIRDPDFRPKGRFAGSAVIEARLK